MTIALFLQAIQALTGSQFVKDKLQRSEHVIRVLKAVGLDPEHPPADFEAVYAYAIVEYGYGKPDVCLEIFRAGEIRSGLRRNFDENDPQGWLTIGEEYLASSEIGERVRSAGCDLKQELAEFAAAFLKVTRRSQTPKETLVQHQLRKIERTIDRKLEQVAGQLEAIGKSAVLSLGETLVLASANCRAAGLADQMRSWFEVLGYRLEKSEKWELDYFEWVIEIPKRRGFDRVLVRGIVGEVGVQDVMALRESVGASRVDEGWVVTARRISKAARSIVEQPENADLFCFTFDEFLDQDADFEGYATWLMGDIEARGIEARYVPLACTKEEFDSVTHQRLGMSRYGESDGWTEGYIDLWLDDPAKEHLSILGEFGTGKTWLTLHYATIALRKYQVAKAAGIERPRLPIVIPLRDYAKAVSVESLFSEFFFRKHEIPIPGYSAFEELNRMGKLLLIFDGFDEMAARVDKQQMINNFWELAKVVVPGSKVILTCRTEHFPDAKEGRSLLNAELQASTRGLSGETPQFEVLELEKFEDSQIRSVLLLASSAETVEQVMGNPQLLDLARRPVMTELILEALPDIEAGKPVDMSRVYLYAVRRKMERDIRAERTFTSMADKLYFLCELSWEMLSNDKMSINYREFPDRIRTLFSSAVQEEKDLDHWHYDMMGQTMLIRNSDGDYTPAHRSLLEFFVAFKFAAELGALAPDFLELAQMKSGIDRTLEPRDYTWSEYFGGGAVAPLKGFVTEKLEVLRSGFGREVLSKAIVDLMISVVSISTSLLKILESTRNLTDEQTCFLGGNFVTLTAKSNPKIMHHLDLSEMSLKNADFRDVFLRSINLTQADLTGALFTGNFGGIQSVRFSHDGNLLATSDSNGHINLWNVYDNSQVLSLQTTTWISPLSFNPSGKLLASGGVDGTIKLWNTETGSCEEFSGHTSSIRTIEFSPNGEIIVSGSDDGNIKIWSTLTREYLLTLQGHTGWVRSVSFSPDGKLLVSGSEDATVKVWKTVTGKCLKTISDDFVVVRSVAFSLDGKYFAIGGDNCCISLWDSKKFGCIKILEGHTQPVRSIAFNPNGEHLASGSEDNSVKVWNINTGKCIDTLREHSYMVTSISYNPHGNLLATGSHDQTVQIWDFDLEKGRNILQGYTNWLWSIDFSPCNSIFASGGDDSVIRLWGINGNKSVKLLKGHKNWVWGVAFSPSSRLLASSSEDKTIRLWNVQSGDCEKILLGHSSRVRCVTFSLDNQLLASASSDCTVRIWDVNTGRCLRLIQHGDAVQTVCFSPNGQLIASAGYDRVVLIHNVVTGEIVTEIKARNSNIHGVSFSPIGKILAMCSQDGKIEIWSVDTWICLATLEGHNDSVQSLSFSPDGKTLVTGSIDNTVRLWNVETGNSKVMIGHSRAVWTVAFSADGLTVASAGQDEIVKFWNVANGTCIQTLRPVRPYEGMNITGVKGLTPGTIASLKALGAIEDEEVRSENVE